MGYNIEDVPPREGFLTGELAGVPPSGPFPEFTAFEAQAVDCIASTLKGAEGLARRQFSFGRVVDRVHTTVGFYTRVEVDRDACAPVELLMTAKAGGHFVVEENLDFWVILSADAGYLSCIEGFTAGADSLEGIELAKLRLVEFTG